ncbi:MAG: helix-turn-helix domain-containing protein [Treponema sp.]|jgi:AraC-like DNA-binding protein/ligand-binding sensor protein|nr:helix-turn-helix domain-containing protein [Treponema sp.]
MQANTIIRKRDTEPLIVKAKKTAEYYKNATGCWVHITDGSLISPEQIEIFDFCKECQKHVPKASQDMANEKYPCSADHREALTQARAAGSSYVYLCPMGFSFWTSPIYISGCYISSLVSGGVLAVSKEEAAKRLEQKSKNTVSWEKVVPLLKELPQKKPDEVKSLACLLLLCAEHICDQSEESAAAITRLAIRKSEMEDQMGFIESRMNAKFNTVKTEDNVYPLDQERALLANLRRGDNETAKKILNDLLGIINISREDNFEFIRFRAMELAILLFWESLEPKRTIDHKTMEANNKRLRRIQESASREELSASLRVVIEDLATEIFSFQGIRHAAALRKAERFIWANYTRKISLKEIAAVSGLSAPYFSTIFKEDMGENLSHYLNRLRVEKASVMLTETNMSLKEIAKACGFEDQSWFSKTFRAHTGITPGKYCEGGGPALPSMTAANQKS